MHHLRARRGELLPPSIDELCIGGMFFVDVAVEGTVDGKHVERDYGHCGNGPAIMAWLRAVRLTLFTMTVHSDGRRRELTLGCAPDLGTVVDARRACRTLARMPELLTRPGTPRTRCRQAVSILGWYRGELFERWIGCAQQDRVRRWIELALGFYTPPRERLRAS